MKAWRPRWIGAAVAIALLVSLLAVTPALADDTPPPADPPPAEVVAEQGVAPDAGAPPVEGPATEPPPEAAPAEQPTEPVPPVEPTAPEPAPPTDGLLAEVPDGTTVAVVGEAGEVLPLASAEAAEVLATGDPVWCPTGVLPGGAGCTTNYGSLWALADDFVPTGNGVIWIVGGIDPSASPVTIDGGPSGTWQSAASFALTLQGGWNGPGFTTIDTTDPSVFSVPLSIIYWQGAVTLNDIVIDSVSGPGLYVDANGPVTVNRAKVKNSGSGAWLDNTGGTGGVVVKDSEFTDSTADMGLGVWSNGAITLKDITATGNAGDGAYLDNLGGSAAPISLTGVNIFAENGSDGLVAQSHGSINASHLVANVNGGWGAYLSNHDAASPQPVTLTSYSEFKYNGAGVTLSSLGAITASNLTASNNDYDGVVLDNSHIGAIGDVKVTGYLRAEGNGDDGVQIWSNGAILLASLSVHDNGLATSGGYGAFLDNTTAAAAKPITLTGMNVFSDNYLTGLVAMSRGAISVNALTANRTMDGMGAVLDNIASGPAAPQKITLTGGATLNDNGSTGLSVHSYGAITIANLTASWNGSDGAEITNYRADATKPMPVSLTGSVTTDGNGYDGLYLTSLGAVTVANVTSTSNGHYGAYLDNDFIGAKGGVNVNGTSYFGDNDYTGLEVFSLGNIVVQDFDAIENEGYGVYLGNADLGAVGNVTVGTNRASWCNGLWDNQASGMEIYSNGTVTMSNVCAEDNGEDFGDYGVRIRNDTAATAKPVVLKGRNRFNGNVGGGLSVLSKGAITAAGLEAYDNQNGDGVYLDNTSASPATPQNVTLSGANDFGGNLFNGLTIDTYGSVTASNLYADDNAGDGIRIDNATGATAVKPVTVNGYLTAYDNGGYGAHVISLGAIKVANLDAWSNFNGAWLDNAGAGAAGGVTLTGTAYVTENQDIGLAVTSRGAITFTLADAYVGRNGDYGWYLDNASAATPQPVKLSVSSGNDIDFWDNDSYGIWVRSKGAISVTSLSSEGNGGFGAYLTNNFIGASGGINLTGNWGRFHDNASYGLWAESQGPITVKLAHGLNANGNLGGWGAKLDNVAGVAPISLAPAGVWGSGFNWNSAEGLIVVSRGAVTLADIEAMGNGAIGADINNASSGPGSPQNVTLSVAGGFFSNQLSGLHIDSYGAITLNNVVANNNGLGGTGHGADLDNFLGGGGPVKAVTLNGTNRFTDNHGNGLNVTSLGLIKINNLTAGWNYEEGAHLDNQWVGASGGITLTGTNQFEGNDGNGLLAYSHGAITLSNLTANYNAGDGAYIETIGLAAPQKVTLTGVNNFSGNGDYGAHTGSGLQVWASGQITLSNITARWNADTGAVIDNEGYAGGVPAAITLGGENVFSGNYDDGLYFLSLGSVFLSRVTADDNGDDGIDGWSDGAVELSCASLTRNGYAGWYMGSATSLILRGVHAFGNTIINDYWYGPTPPVYFRSCP